MSIVSAADARKNFSEVLAHSQNEAVFIERRGQRAAVVVSPEQYERMIEALAAAGGNQTRAAELIAMPLRTFQAKLRFYAITRPGQKSKG